MASPTAAGPKKPKARRRSRMISRRRDWMYEDLTKHDDHGGGDSDAVVSFGVSCTRKRAAGFLSYTKKSIVYVDLLNSVLWLDRRRGTFPVNSMHAVDAAAAKQLSVCLDRSLKKALKHEKWSFETESSCADFLSLVKSLQRTDEAPRTVREYESSKKRAPTLDVLTVEGFVGEEDDDANLWHFRQPLRGEEPCFGGRVNATLFHPETPLNGVLYLTNYRLSFHKFKRVSDVEVDFTKIEVLPKRFSRRPYVVKPVWIAPASFIISVTKTKAIGILKLSLRNGSNVHLGVDDAQTAADVISWFEKFKYFDFSDSHFRALKFHNESLVTNGWKVYDNASECRKMLARAEENSVELFDNSAYEVVPTYPSEFLIPKGSSEFIDKVASYRSKRRVPAVTFVDAQTKCVLARSAQPTPGLKGKRCTHDENMVTSMRPSTPDGNVLLMDARGLPAAVGNQIGRGKGPENPAHYSNTTLMFMGIANIHSMRNSQKSLQTLLAQARTPSYDRFWTKIGHSGWLKHVNGVLAASTRVAEALRFDNSSVLVHCSDGWDRTAQMCALAQVILDGTYRTCRGLVCVVEKEFLAFGHKCGDRLGFSDCGEDERSPILLQFLDALHQIVVRYPSFFEYTNALLVSLAVRIHDSKFGTFLDNTHKQRMKRRLNQTLSVWDSLFDVSTDGSKVVPKRAHHLNSSYDSNTFERPVWPDTRPSKTSLWEAYFDA